MGKVNTYQCKTCGLETNYLPEKCPTCGSVGSFNIVKTTALKVSSSSTTAKSHPSIILMIVIICIILGAGLLINSRISQPNYQVILKRVMYDERSAIIMVSVENMGPNVAYISVDYRSQLIGMGYKIKAGEVYTCWMDRMPLPPRNVTCRIDWSENPSTKPFTHTTQWYIMTDEDII